MKKYFAFAAIAFLFACSSTDSNSDQNSNDEQNQDSTKTELTFNSESDSIIQIAKSNEEALEALNKILEKNPKDAATLAHIAFIEYDKDGDTKKVKAALEKAMIANPKSEIPRIYMAEVYMDENNMNAALKQLSIAKDLQKNNPNIYFNEGIIMMMQAKIEEANQLFNFAIKLNPNFEEALELRGQTLVSMGNPEHALSDFNQVLKMNPNNITTRLNRAFIFSESGKQKLAIEDCDYVLKLDPQNFTAYSKRGVAQNRLQNYKAALKDLNKALEINPEDAASTLYKAQVLLNLNKKEEACAFFEKAKQLGAPSAQLHIDKNCK